MNNIHIFFCDFIFVPSLNSNIPPVKSSLYVEPHIIILYLGILEKDLIGLRKVNSDVEAFLGIPGYFTYDVAYLGLGLSIFVTLFIFIGYVYTEKYRPAWLYKVFKTQSYSDGRFMFRILNGMLSAGISFHKTSVILSKDYA